jgi:hypothetical protein
MNTVIQCPEVTGAVHLFRTCEKKDSPFPAHPCLSFTSHQDYIFAYTARACLGHVTDAMCGFNRSRQSQNIQRRIHITFIRPASELRLVGVTIRLWKHSVRVLAVRRVYCQRWAGQVDLRRCAIYFPRYYDDYRCQVGDILVRILS